MWVRYLDFLRACGALFSANAIFCKGLISDFFQGMPFSLTNSISAPGQILRKKKRAPTQIFSSISDGLNDLCAIVNTIPNPLIPIVFALSVCQ